MDYHEQTASAVSATLFADMLHRYEIDQRLRIIKTADIVLACVATIGIGSQAGIVFIRPAPTSLLPPLAIVSIFGALLAFLAGCFVAYHLAQRRSVQAASWVTTMSSMVIVCGVQLVWLVVGRHTGIASGFDDESWALFPAHLVTVALAIVIGDDLLFFTATSLVSVFCIILIWFGFLSTGQDVSTRQDVSSVFASILLIPWTAGLIMRAMRDGFRRVIYNAANLQVAVQQAKQLDALKDQFITSVNHELRNPIMALDTNIYLMQETMYAPNAEQIRVDALSRVRDSVRNLKTLVESILSVKGLERGQEEFTPQVVSVLESLGAAVRKVPPSDGQLTARDLRIQIPAGLTIWGDPMRLQQILTNLLSNACKYSPLGTPVEVNATIDGDHTHPQVVIAVRDYGYGIPPDQQPLLFGRFVRLERDLASPITGNGLGLYLCRVYAEAMGGMIDLASSGIAGEGATFFLRLPLPPPETPTAQEESDSRE
jgi:signal transduction histidine kinase